MSRPSSPWWTTLLFVAAACDPVSTEPLDGGGALDFDRDPDRVKLRTNDPCWRQENGGWHRSVGHCEPMTRSERVSGVWVTAFEERSFFAEDTTVPNAKDWRRYTSGVELNEAELYRLAGVRPSSSHGDAYLVSFTGRRTRDPWFVDCQGVPHFTFVVDQLVSARYLGAMAPVSHAEFRADLKSRPVIVTRKHGGRWGDEEAEAVERCR